MVASKFVGGMKLIRKNMTKKLKEGLNEAKYTHKYPSITAMAKKDYADVQANKVSAGGVKIAAGSHREATGKRSQPAFITIEGDKKIIDAYKKIPFNGRGNYSDVIKSLKESVNESVNEDVFMESITKDGITETHIYWESDGKPHGYSWTFVNELNEQSIKVVR